ncbi:MAG TPA: shikimate kinase [Gammaproteobacteria bacterium]
MTNTNIVLTGFMGIGKSTVGRILAKQLGYRFIDTDRLIESRVGKSVANIFKTLGEPAFRQMETDLARELSEQRDLVIATGGGMLVNPLNQQLLEQNGRIFCLTAGVDEIINRLSNPRAQARRPLLQGRDLRQHVQQLMQERMPVYARFLQIDTSGIDAKEVADAILKIVASVETAAEPDDAKSFRS